MGKSCDCVNMDIQIHTIAKRRYCIDITEIHTFTETAQADNADDDDDNDCGGMEAGVKPLDNAVVWAGGVVPEELCDGDGNPDCVGLAASRLRDVRHAAHQVLSHSNFPAGCQEVIHVPPAFGRRQLGHSRGRHMDGGHSPRGDMVSNVAEDHTVSQGGG